MSKSLAKQIKEIRNKLNLSQERFGKKLGLSGKTISAYETGRSTPPFRILDNISQVYNVPLLSIKSERKEEMDNKLRVIEQYISDLKDILNNAIR